MEKIKIIWKNICAYFMYYIKIKKKRKFRTAYQCKKNVIAYKLSTPTELRCLIKPNFITGKKKF